MKFSVSSMIRLLLFAALLTAAFNAPAEATDELIPLEHWAYPYLDRLVTRGVLTGLDLADRPYSRHEIIRSMQNARPENSADRWMLRLLDGEFREKPGTGLKPGFPRPGSPWLRATADLTGRTDSETETAYRVRDDLDILFDLRQDVFLSTRLRVENADIADSSFGGVEERNYLTEMKYGYLYARSGAFDLRAGRFETAWGASGRRSLVLTPGAPAMDGVAASVRWKRLKYETMFAELPRLEDHWGTRINRFHFVHRLVFDNGRLSLGATEIFLFGGEDTRPPWTLLNPLIPFFTAAQNRADFDDANLMYMLDVVWIPVDSWKIHLQGLLDDLQVDSRHRDTAPSSTAWMGSLRKSFALFDLEIEAAWIDTWTYNNADSVAKYLYHPGTSALLGYPTGPDAFQAVGRVAWYPAQGLTIAPAFVFTMRGERGLEVPWNGLEEPNPKHPSGTVETTSAWELAIIKRFSYRFGATLLARYAGVENPGHIAGESSEQTSIMLNFTWKVFDVGR